MSRPWSPLGFCNCLHTGLSASSLTPQGLEWPFKIWYLHMSPVPSNLRTTGWNPNFWVAHQSSMTQNPASLTSEMLPRQPPPLVPDTSAILHYLCSKTHLSLSLPPNICTCCFPWLRQLSALVPHFPISTCPVPEFSLPWSLPTTFSTPSHIPPPPPQCTMLQHNYFCASSWSWELGQERGSQ